MLLLPLPPAGQHTCSQKQLPITCHFPCPWLISQADPRSRLKAVALGQEDEASSKCVLPDRGMCNQDWEAGSSKSRHAITALQLQFWDIPVARPMMSMTSTGPHRWGVTAGRCHLCCSMSLTRPAQKCILCQPCCAPYRSLNGPQAWS